uniref:Serine/threonine-protein kinase greatwall n=1 Tax=Ditylenchus dipsaci TaxID=166011 RepID=A0A915E2X3_9BILA
MHCKHYILVSKKEKILTKKFSQKYLTDLEPDAALSDFQILRALGSGSFGVVEMVRHTKTGQLYAMKTIDIEENTWEGFEIEVRTNRSTSSKFIVKMHYSFWDEERTTGYLVFQLVSGGDFSHLLKIYQPLQEDQVRFYAANMVMAVQYLQKRSMVHRDLKPANFLFGDNGYLLLADFGLSRPMKKACKTFSVCGTYKFMAPEMLQKYIDPSFAEGYTQAVDWWSVGAILLELYTGKSQFWSPDFMVLVTNIVKKEIKLGYSGADFVKRHPFFDGYDWQKLNDQKILAPYEPVFDENKKLKSYREISVIEQSNNALLENESNEKYIDTDFKTAKNAFQSSNYETAINSF